MKKNRITIWILAIVILATLTCCKPVEKSVLSFSGVSSRTVYDSLLLDEAEILIHGRVTKQLRQYFSQDEKGNSVITGKPCQNTQATVYEFEIEKVYKGSVAADKIEVTVLNGSGLDKDLFLYGENEKTVLAKPVNKHYLELDKEYILSLKQLSDKSCENYGITDKIKVEWIFVSDGEGNFTLTTKSGQQVTLNLNTLADDIACAPQKVKEHEAKELAQQTVES